MVFHCNSNRSGEVCVARQLHVLKKFYELSVRASSQSEALRWQVQRTNPENGKTITEETVATKIPKLVLAVQKSAEVESLQKNHLSIALSYFISFTLRISFTDDVALSLPVSSDSSQDAKQCEREVYTSNRIMRHAISRLAGGLTLQRTTEEREVINRFRSTAITRNINRDKAAPCTLRSHGLKVRSPEAPEGCPGWTCCHHSSNITHQARAYGTIACPL